MKKLFLISVIIFLFASQGYSSVTTFDGAITLDFYEDTQSGDGRWILDFTVNNYIGPGGADTSFSLKSTNISINFYNQYNDLDSNYFDITGYYAFDENGFPIDENGLPVVFGQYIFTGQNDQRTPGGTTFEFYTLPTQEGEPIIGTFDLTLGWKRGNAHSFEIQDIQLTGPIGFATVPEPAGMCLFALGAFFLKFLIKRK